MYIRDALIRRPDALILRPDALILRPDALILRPDANKAKLPRETCESYESYK